MFEVWSGSVSRSGIAAVCFAGSVLLSFFFRALRSLSFRFFLASLPGCTSSAFVSVCGVSRGPASGSAAVGECNLFRISPRMIPPPISRSASFSGVSPGGSMVGCDEIWWEETWIEEEFQNEEVVDLLSTIYFRD